MAPLRDDRHTSSGRRPVHRTRRHRKPGTHRGGDGKPPAPASGPARRDGFGLDVAPGGWDGGRCAREGADGRGVGAGSGDTTSWGGVRWCGVGRVASASHGNRMHRGRNAGLECRRGDGEAGRTAGLNPAQRRSKRQTKGRPLAKGDESAAAEPGLRIRWSYRRVMMAQSSSKRSGRAGRRCSLLLGRTANLKPGGSRALSTVEVRNDSEELGWKRLAAPSNVGYIAHSDPSWHYL